MYVNRGIGRFTPDAAKSGIRNYAFAVTESGTPEVKEILTRH